MLPKKKYFQFTPQKMTINIFFIVLSFFSFFKGFVVGLPHLATYIFLIFSMNEPELCAGIDPGMALTLTISI
jgi:hypothetical protein